MKQTFTFYPSVIASTASKTDMQTFDLSVEAYENGEYLKSLHLLLDSIDKNLREKYGNRAGNEFRIPHGPIMLHLKQTRQQLCIAVPYMTLPEGNPIAMMRLAADLNFDSLDLARLTLKDQELWFEYSCPAELAHPRKIRQVLEEICKTGAWYDHDFRHLFQAERMAGPHFIPYAPETTDYIYEAIRNSCDECLQALGSLEPVRNFNDMWYVITTTLLKVMYIAHPQGQLCNTLQKAISDMDRDIAIAEVVAGGKQAIEDLRNKTKAEIAEDLYYVETFISGKKRSNLQNIRENYEKCYKQVSAAIEAGDYRTVCLKITHKFYETYYHHHMQEELDAILVKAMSQASAQPLSQAARILYRTLQTIMHTPVTTRPASGPIAA